MIRSAQGQATREVKGKHYTTKEGKRMKANDLSDFIAQRAEIVPPGILAVTGTVSEQPAMWISSAAQIGCMRYPSLEKKDAPAKM